MSIAVNWFGLGLLAILEAPYDLEAEGTAGRLMLSLHTSSDAPNRDTNDFFDDATNELANGNGYTTGGIALTSVATSYDSASDEVRFDCDDPAWTFTAGKTWLYGVLYDNQAGASSTDPVFALLTWDTSQIVSTSYTLTINAAGLLYDAYGRATARTRTFDNFLSGVPAQDAACFASQSIEFAWVPDNRVPQPEQAAGISGSL